jgi:long-chain fatty acid transport protein
MNKWFRVVNLTLLGVLISASLQAGGPKLHLNGIRNLGMGYVGTSLSVDASTIFFNPGALSFLDGPQIQLGTTLLIPRTSFLGQFPSLYQTEMLPQVFTPAYLYAALGLGRKEHKKVWLGLAFNNPFLLSSLWPDKWAGNQLSQEFSLTLFTLQPTLSWQLTPKLGLGAGFNLGFGSLLVRKALPENGPDDTQTNLQYSGNGRVNSFNIGVYYEPNEHLRLGLSYRSAQVLAIDSGEARYSVPLSLEDLYPDGHFQSRIPLPSHWNMGLTYQANSRLQLVAELNLAQWSTLDTIKMTFAPVGLQVQDTQFVHNFRDAITFRLGGAFQLNERFQLRTGAFYELSPVQDGWLSPEIPHANHIGLSMGLGIDLIPKLEMDLAYLYEYAGERTSFYRPAAFGGTYLTYSFYLGLGLRYRI